MFKSFFLSHFLHSANFAKHILAVGSFAGRACMIRLETTLILFSETLEKSIGQDTPNKTFESLFFLCHLKNVSQSSGDIK